MKQVTFTSTRPSQSTSHLFFYIWPKMLIGSFQNYTRWRLTLNHCTLPYNFITVWHSKFLWTQMIIFEYLLPLWTDKNILISNHYFSASRVCQIVKRFMVEDLCRIIVNYFITVCQTIILKTKLKVKFVMSYIHWMLKYELIYAISSFTQWPTL